MDTRALVDSFLDFVLVEEEQDPTALAEWLDRLAMDLHNVSFQFDEKEYSDPPVRDYREWRDLISRRFPYLGHYNTITHDADHHGDGEIFVGDALDDIADISAELQDVRWYFENTSDANALWYLENGYRTHWARHLRDLQSHLLNVTWGI